MRGLGGFSCWRELAWRCWSIYWRPLTAALRRDRLRRLAFCGSVWLLPAKFAPVSRLGSFSPSVALSMPVRREPRLASLEIMAAPAPAPSQPAQASVASEVQRHWQTTVISTTSPAPTELTPRDPDARSLVLDIQRQLRRVGCCSGPLDGSWRYATKDAMKEFTHRVNATLPLDKPDYVQLALIQSQSDEAWTHAPLGSRYRPPGAASGFPSWRSPGRRRRCSLGRPTRRLVPLRRWYCSSRCQRQRPLPTQCQAAWRSVPQFRHQLTCSKTRRPSRRRLHRREQ